MGSNNWLAAWQVANTLVPYGLLWWLAVSCLRQGSWLLLPVLALMVLFLARCFSLMHDCGHNALFRDASTNRAVGFLFGIVAGIPQLPWSRGHAFHHRHNGNWAKYRGLRRSSAPRLIAVIAPAPRPSTACCGIR